LYEYNELHELHVSVCMNIMSYMNYMSVFGYRAGKEESTWQKALGLCTIVLNVLGHLAKIVQWQCRCVSNNGAALKNKWFGCSLSFGR
jgi:hypothetical protein